MKDIHFNMCRIICWRGFLKVHKRGYFVDSDFEFYNFMVDMA